MKVIPAIDLMDGQVVRLFKGDPAQKTIYSDDPIGIAKKYGVKISFLEFMKFGAVISIISLIIASLYLILYIKIII